MVKVTYYLEVISSWCHWAEPAWSELKKRYAGQCEFDWKIALMPPDSYPVSRSQCEWFLSPQWFHCALAVYAQRRMA
jgi:hypothetical protein